MDKLSIIIPTLQKDLEVLNKLVEELVEDNCINEIIIIDNTTKGFAYNSRKIRVITPKKNLFVNSAWNLGVKEAKNKYIGILNDDLLLPKNYCSEVLNFIKNTENVGFVGIDTNALLNSKKEDFGTYPICENFEFKKMDSCYDTGFWGSAIFGRKENYYQIPKNIKIWCGDNFLQKMNIDNGKQNYQVINSRIKHLISLSVNSSKKIKRILKDDIRNYSKIDKRFQNHDYYKAPLDWLFSIKTIDNDHLSIKFLGIEFKTNFSRKNQKNSSSYKINFEKDCTEFNPIVSIIITCYNKEKYVREAIESALNQTYKNIEIVCIDDASTDNSKDVLKEFAKKHNNIVLLEEDENIGVCKARNKAIDKASGEYILPLDADDTIEPTYVDEAINVFKFNSNVNIVYSRVKNLNTKKEIFKQECNAENLLYSNFITCSSIFKKSEFLSVGGYDERFNNIGCEDWDLYLSFLEKGYNFYKIDKILFNYRTCTNNNRTTVQEKSLNNIYYEVLFKHKNIYLKKDLFSYLNKHIYLINNLNKYENKYKKYKTLFYIFLTIIISEFIIIVYFIFKKFGGV